MPLGSPLFFGPRDVHEASRSSHDAAAVLWAQNLRNVFDCMSQDSGRLEHVVNAVGRCFKIGSGRWCPVRMPFSLAGTRARVAA